MNEITEIKKENSELGKGEFYDLMRFIENIDNNMEQLWDHSDPDNAIKDELKKLEPCYYCIESLSYQAQLMKNINDKYTDEFVQVDNLALLRSIKELKDDIVNKKFERYIRREPDWWSGGSD